MMTTQRRCTAETALRVAALPHGSQGSRLCHTLQCAVPGLSTCCTHAPCLRFCFTLTPPCHLVAAAVLKAVCIVCSSHPRIWTLNPQLLGPERRCWCCASCASVKPYT